MRVKGTVAMGPVAEPLDARHESYGTGDWVCWVGTNEVVAKRSSGGWMLGASAERVFVPLFGFKLHTCFIN